AVQQSRTRCKQRTGTDRHEPYARTHRPAKPQNDVLFQHRIGGSIGLRTSERNVRRTRNNDQRAIRQSLRQRLHTRDREANGTDRSWRGPDIANIEPHLILLKICLAQNLKRSRHIEQKHTGRDNDINRNYPGNVRLTTHAAFRSPGAASACSTVTIRAKRFARTSSVRALISAALHSRPVASIIGKVKVASLTKST